MRVRRIPVGPSQVGAVQRELDIRLAISDPEASRSLEGLSAADDLAVLQSVQTEMQVYDEFTAKNFPDCTVPADITRKSEYLRMVKLSTICVATMGLDRSNGWKLAEYVAHSKPIVSETLYYEVPGDFAAGKNYLEFSTVDTCIQAVMSLYENPDYCYQMMLANHSYYHRFLRPDILVWNSLQRLADKIEI